MSPAELADFESRIGRAPAGIEADIISAEWSEHCSYKSSKMHLGMLPSVGPLVIRENGLDSGVLDVGNGYVVTAHIESHNHPSAVEPYGGAATGVGGVIRDILSAGTRPIAILDGLRFGDAGRDRHARWLFKSAVSGIADYGNCIGVPTIGGELEFDSSYGGYALVDVAAIGFGRRDSLIRNSAGPGDCVVLLGGYTGRDGMGGSQFASDQLDSQDRSAVQIPDPFAEKLLIEAVIEARRAGVIRAMKDLGGGGLSCAISETADALDIGIDVDVLAVHTRGPGMRPAEIMVSESQERMLVITRPGDLARLQGICSKFGVPCSVIGRATAGGMMRVRSGPDTVADLPASIVANATLLDLPSKRPAYLDAPGAPAPEQQADHTGTLGRLLSSPNICSRAWVYGQYDHEVGIRTVVRPGMDASVLRLDNGRYLAVSMDANPLHCYVDPGMGAAGCLEEACRNVACTGARPAAMLDHMQFGSPEDPEIFWTFLESVRAMASYCTYMDMPCIGGKVSLYNETPAGPIKPTPMALVLGISDAHHMARPATDGDALLVLGDTHDEMGGSEFYEHIHGMTGGTCPAVDPAASKRNMDAVIGLVGSGIAKTAHDCSKGGLAVAISEVCLASDVGCHTDISAAPGTAGTDAMLFSESHSRYVVVVDRAGLRAAESALGDARVPFAAAGRFGGHSVRLADGARTLADLSVDKAQEGWSGALGGLLRG